MVNKQSLNSGCGAKLTTLDRLGCQLVIEVQLVFEIDIPKPKGKESWGKEEEVW